MKETANSDILFLCGILALALTLLILFMLRIYKDNKPKVYETGESIKYIRNEQYRSSEIVEVTPSHLSMKNGDIVFYRDVL